MKSVNKCDELNNNKSRVYLPPRRQVWVWESEQLVRVVLAQPPREVMQRQQAIADTLSKVADGTAVVDEVRYHVRQDNTVNTEW